MKPWRAALAGVVLAVLAAGLFGGPDGIRLALFWLFFFALPGGVTMRFLGLHAWWPYAVAGAISGCLGLIGAAYPVTPSAMGVFEPAVVGAMFGTGWCFLFNLGREPRSDVSPIQRTVSWWGS